MADLFPTKQQFYDAEKDLRTVNAVSNSRDPDTGAEIDTWVTRRGDITDTLAGRLKRIGIERIGDFTAGCTVTARNQGVLEVGGSVYVWLGAFPTGGKVVPPGSTPASTGGVGPTGWLDIGDASAYSNVLLELAKPVGSSLIGTEYGKTVASASNINLTHDELATTAGVAGYNAFVSGLGAFTWAAGSTAGPDGVNVIQVTGVATGRWVRDNVALSFADLRTKLPSQSRAVTLYEHRAGFKYGGGNFVWDVTSTVADNGGTVAAVAGVTTGRWVRTGYSALDAAMFGLPKVGDCLPELQAIEAIQYATGIDCHFNIDGTYETIGEVNWPWRQETVPAATFKDYKGARLVCKGPGVIFKTTSATGADILQLNSVANFSVIGWPTLTATLTATTYAGSNGVSVTNGGQNIYCEVEAKDLPWTVKPTYLDGGKAITIQNGASTLLPYQNVKLICRRAENCAYGATADVATQPLVAQLNWYGNLLDVTAIDCYRAAQLSADSPTEGTVPSNGLNMGLDIIVDAVNCQQDYVESRGWCVNTKVRTQRNKGTAALIGKNPNDSQIFVDHIVASYGGSFEIDGAVTSVDYLHGVGGLITTNGNSQTKGKALRYSVRYQGALASGDQVRLIDAGGNTATGCTFNIFGTVGFSAAALAAAGNSVFVNGFATLRGSISA